MAKKKKSEKIATDHDKFQFCTFRQVPVLRFFNSNSELCFKISSDQYIRWRNIEYGEYVKIVEWDKADYDNCVLIDITRCDYKYKERVSDAIPK